MGTALSYPTQSFHARVQEYRANLIRETLQKFEGNRTRAAKHLGLQRTYLLRLIRDHGINVPPGPCSNPDGKDR